MTTDADAFTTLNARVRALIDADALLVHDGDVPYAFEIVTTRDDQQLRARLLDAHGAIIDDDRDGLQFDESLCGIDFVTGQPDPHAVYGPQQHALADLLTLIEAHTAA